MTEPPSKTRPAHDQVLSILDDLDSFAPLPSNSRNISKSSPGHTVPKLPTSNALSSTGTRPSKLTSPTTANPTQNNDPGDAQSVLDFIDEITQRSSTPTASIKTKKTLAGNQPSVTHSRPISRNPSSSSLDRRTTTANEPEPHGQPRSPSSTQPPVASSSWGWGSVLKHATSTVFNQAKSAAGQVQSVVSDPSKSSEIVKSFNSNLQSQLSGQTEAAKKWKEGVLSYVKASGIDQLGKDLQATGLKSLTDIINMVAPPISKHEIIDVQLSYDMVGYDGIETLVYRSLSKVMEQVDGGELILNKGDEERAKTPEQGEPERDLQAVEGMLEGYKLALANLEQVIKRKESQKAESVEDPKKTEDTPLPTESSDNNELPITHCPVYVRIQPILSRLPVFLSTGPTCDLSAGSATAPTAGITKGGVKVEEEQHLFFLILLRDVKHSLDHATLTQSIPASWLEIPFEENEWVEDIMVEVIRRGTETIGQQYVNGRISGRSVRNATVTEEAPLNAKLPSESSSQPEA